jgi:hypothetical protein
MLVPQIVRSMVEREMLTRIESAARLSVSRACGFGLLATGTFMLGMMGNLHLAFRCGGFLLLMMALILILKSFHVVRQPYRSTETWLILRQEDRPTAETAQQIISTVLHDIYVEYARLSALGGGALLAVGLVLGWISG